MQDQPAEPGHPDGTSRDEESTDAQSEARLFARGTGLFWAVLALVLGIGALSAASAAALAELLLFGPWAAAAVVLAFRLLVRPPTRRLLLASLALAAASVVFGVFAIFGSGPDAASGIIAFTLTAAGTAAYSLLTLQRLPRSRLA